MKGNLHPLCLIWINPPLVSHYNHIFSLITTPDHYLLGGRQVGVCAEGRDRRKRLDPLGGRRWASSGEKTSSPAMNINVCNLDTLIQIQNASQRCMCGAYIFMCGSWIGPTAPAAVTLMCKVHAHRKKHLKCVDATNFLPNKAIFYKKERPKYLDSQIKQIDWYKMIQN